MDPKVEQQLLNDVSEIKNCLLGSEFTDKKGLVHVVSDHAERIGETENWIRTKTQNEDQKDKKQKFYIALAVCLFAGVQALQAIVFVFSLTSKK